MPDTALITSLPPRPVHTPQRSRPMIAGQDRELVRDMLSYLAASLPVSVGAPARLLALQCALRSDASGRAYMPAGLTRGMALGCTAALWQELEAARWLGSTADDCPGRIVRLTDPLTGLPGAKARSRAADWALRLTRGRGLVGMAAGTRMTALALLAHTRPHTHNGTADVHQVVRMRAASLPELLKELRRLIECQLLAAWTLDPLGDDLSWELSGCPGTPQWF